MKTFKFNNNKMYYRVFGSGDPVLFLHGFLEDHTMWESIYPAIEAMDYQIILVDLPCHGKSRYTKKACSMTDMAKIIHAFCQTERIKTPFVFGHSMGGYVGLELLKLMSIRLTLIHSNFWDDPVSKKKDRDRVITIVEENKMRLIQEAVPNLFAEINRDKCIGTISKLIDKAAEIPKNEIIASTRGMRDRLNNANLINKYNVRIVHGELDSIVKTEKLNAELTKLKKQPEIHILENCGHMSIWESPNALINCLKLIVFR